MSDSINIVDDLYSFANKNEISPRLIIRNNDSFDTLLNLIKNKFLEDLTIEEIYNSVISDDIEIDDIIVIYYILISNNVLSDERSVEGGNPLLLDDYFKQFIFVNLSNDIINFFDKEHREWNPNFELLTTIFNNQKFDLLDFMSSLPSEEVNINDLIVNIKDVKREYIIITYFFYLLLNDDINAFETIKQEYGDDKYINEIFKDVDFVSYEDWEKSIITKRQVFSERGLPPFNKQKTVSIENYINEGFPLNEIIKKLGKYNIKDIIMNYYELLLLSDERSVEGGNPLLQDNIIEIIYYETDWLVNEYMKDKYKTWTAINNTKYDDSDRISLHKWRYHRKRKINKEFPLILSLIRPRTIHDKLKTNGTRTKIYESLSDIITGQITNGKQSPSEILSYIKLYSENLINEEDIAMTFYELYINDPESVSHITEIIIDNIINYNKNNNLYKNKKKPTKIKDIKNELDIIDGFYELMEADKFEFNYEDWSKRIESSIKEDNESFGAILDIYIQFLSYENENDNTINISNIKTISSLKSFNPTLHGRPVTPEDGYDIFNKSKISERIPFICYNDSYGKSLFKIFNPRESINEINDNISNRDKFILPEEKLKDKDTIYMTMWLGNEVSIFKSPRGSFFVVIYHLNGNKLTIESTVKDESEDIFSLTNNAYLYSQKGLPSLVFGKGQDIKTRLEFDIKNFLLNEYIFVDYLLMDNLMKNYLYIDESKDSFGTKKRLDVHYNHLFEENVNAAVSFTISQKNGDLHINVTQADPDSVDKFLSIFRLLLIHYKDRIKDSEIKKIYDEIFPNMIDILQKNLTERMEAKIKKEKRIRTVISSDKSIKLPNQPLIDSSKGSNIIKNESKSLSTNGRGYLSKNLEFILNNYSDNRDYKFYRFGTTSYPNNSLLHCVCYAIDHPDYINIQDDKLKEIYILKLRKFIANNIEISLLKQELFDYSNDEIMELLINDSKFFDPSLLYRAIEEIFNINLYVFTYDEKREIDIPRNKIFHSRPLRLYRPTVLIMKIIAGGYQIPKCELIVDYNDEKSEIIKLFGENMTNICHDLILQNYNNIITISRSENNYIARSNINYHIDNIKIFDNNIISQYLDNDGKMRSIIVNINDEIITVSIPPSQPLNLPIFTDIKLSTLNNVIKIFGEPSGVTLNNENNVNGLWYKILDITYGYYIPIIPTKNYNFSVPIGPDDPFLTKINITSRLRKMKRIINIITELVKWCYMLCRSEIKTTPFIFQQKYFEVIERNIDSSDYYDLSNIERKLPDIYSVHTIDDAINIMSKLAPTLFNNQGKIIMYSQEFSSRLKDMLINYDKMISSAKIKSKSVIDNFFMTSDDYIMSQNTKIFLSRKDLDNWLDSLKSSREDKNLLHTSIGLINSQSLEPYIFQTSDNSIYIIQNTITQTADKALTISKLWKENNINYGANITTRLISEPHFIYGISSNSQIYPIVDNTDNTDNSDDYLEILYYGSQAEYNGQVKSTYAALLRLI